MMDMEETYCFRIPYLSGRNLISFNKKFTKITEHEDYLEVEFMDWYIKKPKPGQPYWEQTMRRIHAIEQLNEEYLTDKKTNEND